MNIVWRLVTASLCTFSIFSLFIDLLIFIPTVMTKERALGTVRYILYFLMTSALVQLIFVLIMYLIHFKYEKAMEVSSYGIIPLFFADIVADCLQRPEEIRSYPYSLS